MKRSSLFTAAIFALTLSSCNNGNDTALLYESNMPKPAVAVVPLIDNSNHALAWSLSDEITFTLCAKLDKQNRLDLALPGKVKADSRKMGEIHNPFGDDISWVKGAFSDEEFVVFLEMVDHSEVPNYTAAKAPPETLSAQLNLALRLRIIDLREENPKIVLQEIIRDSHFIPRQFTSYNFPQTPWTTDEFFLSPVGIAHQQLLTELKGRIEDYILLSAGE